MNKLNPNKDKKSYKGFFKPFHPEKYKGNPLKIVYRSRWELKYMSELDLDKSVIQWSSEEVIIFYKNPLDQKTHRYFPDFYVKKLVNGEIKEYIIEIKPYKQTIKPKKPAKQKNERYPLRFLKEAATFVINTQKWSAAEHYCKNRGYEFVLLTEKELKVK
jgi:hypothetical protein